MNKQMEELKNKFDETEKKIDDLEQHNRNLRIQNQKIKEQFELFKGRACSHIYQEIIEKLELENEIIYVSREDIQKKLDYVEQNWETNWDNFVENFEEQHPDL